MNTVLDKGTGVGDGFSINICYINKDNLSDRPVMYNIEVAPPKKLGDSLEFESISQVSERSVPHGEIYVHCNRLKIILCGPLD